MVVFDEARAGTYAGTMTGGGTFVKQGGGTLAVTGPNTFTGGIARVAVHPDAYAAALIARAVRLSRDDKSDY